MTFKYFNFSSFLIDRTRNKLRFENIQPIAHARVPIVKLTETYTSVDVDVCINNMLATRNTILLRTYADCDVRVRQLGVLVKMWAKVRGVKASDQGNVSKIEKNESVVIVSL